MSSIFSLKTSVEELSSANMGTSRSSYEQTPPTRSVQNASFPNGAIHFRWQCGGSKWWTPSKSYLRMRCLLGRADGSPLTSDDEIAPNMNLCASLFQSLEFRMNDKTVSRVADFVPQCDTIDQRLNKSSSHINSIGASTNFSQGQFEVRQQQVIVDGDNSVIKPLKTSKSRLGVKDAQEFALSDAGVLTQSSIDGGPALNTIFEGGDIIRIDLGAGYVELDIISATANTLKLNSISPTTSIAATVKDFSRLRPVTIEGNTSRKMTRLEILWKPPLSIFNINTALPVGSYELILNPQTSAVYKKYAIQSIGGSKEPNLNAFGAGSISANAQYQFEVEDLYFYCHTVEGPRYDNGTYLLDLNQTTCASEKVTSKSFSQRNFDVSPSTNALTVAFQDLRAGNSTQASTSQFKSYNVGLTETQELKLNRFFINYCGQNLPQPDSDPSFIVDLTTGAKQAYTTQRYYDSQAYSGALFDSGGAETIQEWHERGAYYHILWAKDGNDRSTRVTVNAGFASDTDIANMRMLLFSHSKQICRVRVADGRIVSVEVQDA